MISLRLAVPAVLAAAAVAGCFTYFVTPPARVEVDQRLRPTVLNLTGHPDTGVSKSLDQRPTADDAAAYQQAAEANLRRAPNTQASANTDESPITGLVPLPKRRPITRP